ncbi:MAG: hypothetical protein WDZ96_04880 [Acidimicrobiia bacterium]
MSRSFTIAFLVVAVFAVMTVATAGPTATVGYSPIEFAESPRTTVVVERGDHLWKISKRGLGAILQREPHDQEVRPYWLDTIAINRNSLRSGNPDLIFPGEEVTLPESPDR